jgi:membrane-associated phospholipid phosphatase
LRSRLLPLLALACAAGFVATFFVALHTGRGLRDDALALQRVSGAALPVRAEGAARTLLLAIDGAFVVAAAAAIVVLGLLRRQPGRAVAAVAIVGCSVVSVEALKHGLPHLARAVPAGRPATFPSGHTSIAVSLGLALVVVAPPVLRPVAAVLGAAYAAGVALSLVVLSWHFPSDVVGSFFVCGFWAAAIGSLLHGTIARPRFSVPGGVAALGAIAAGLAIAAVLAGRHPAAVAAVRSSRSVLGLAAVVGVLSLALFAAFTALVEESRE